LKIIGISGKARTGKDEFAKVLYSTFGVKQIAFADKIKWFANEYFDIKKYMRENKKTKLSRMILQGIGSSVKDNITRLFPIIFEDKYKGVSGFPIWVEEIATTYFDVEPLHLNSRKSVVKQILNGIFQMWSLHVVEFAKLIGKGKDDEIWIKYLFKDLKEGLYVISDVRYTNEKEAVESRGGKVARVIRIDAPFISSASHESETNLDNEKDWYFIVTNVHRGDWRNDLTKVASNFIRKLKNDGFFSKEEINNFKIEV